MNKERVSDEGARVLPIVAAAALVIVLALVEIPIGRRIRRWRRRREMHRSPTEARID
jgi:hypothetical protein